MNINNYVNVRKAYKATSTQSIQPVQKVKTDDAKGSNSNSQIKNDSVSISMQGRANLQAMNNTTNTNTQNTDTNSKYQKAIASYQNTMRNGENA